MLAQPVCMLKDTHFDKLQHVYLINTNVFIWKGKAQLTAQDM